MTRTERERTETEAGMAEGAVSVEEFARLTGMGRTWVYQSMTNGTIRSCKIGRRRVIPRSEVKRLLASTLTPAAN